MIKKFIFLFTFATLFYQTEIKLFAEEVILEDKDELKWIELEGISGGRIKFDPNTGTIVDAEESIIFAHIPFSINDISVKSIGIAAFKDCKDMSSISLPNSIENICERAFQGCNSLKNVIIPEGIKVMNGAVFYLCENLEMVAIPSSVEHAVFNIFEGCENLKTVKYGSNIENWNNLKVMVSDYVKIELAERWFEVPEVYGGKLKFNVNTGTIVEAEKTITYANIPTFIEGIAVLAIAPELFYNFKELRAVFLPKTVSIIPVSAFEQCSALALILLPESIESIEKKAFWGCASLEYIKLPSSLKRIEDSAFFDCDNLPYINIPKNVEKIGDFVFGGCYLLDTVVIQGDPMDVGYDAFIYCDKLQTIHFNGSYLQWNTLEINIPESTEIICNNDITMAEFSYENIENISTQQDAIAELEKALLTVSETQLKDANSVNALARFAEALIAEISSIRLETNSDNILFINYDTLANLQNVAEELSNKLSDCINNSGMELSRTLRKIVRINTNSNAIIIIDPNIANSKINTLSVSMNDDMAISLDTNEIVTARAIEISTQKTEDNYQIAYTGGGTPLTICLPSIEGNPNYQAIIENNALIGGRYNPATNMLEAKTLLSDASYSILENVKYFADIDRTSAQMQEAIQVLSSKGIINGREGDLFEPDIPISRAEVATILVRILYAYDPFATSQYADISNDDWFKAIAGSAQRLGIMVDSTNNFRGNDLITRLELTCAISHVLKTKQTYLEVDNLEKYLSEFSDLELINTINYYDVAFATREDLVLRYNDSFMPLATVTRGEAAILLKKIYDRIG
ncbi:MAG: hypothetical protein ATN31_01630 [Candidatus Epulonipiscioides saccharophilum]|nr:MAG: hypothetical protein ATN31_01630 [Epulopiscium sp. AS2M-Bin001]